jgi:hypothetical protein
MRVHEDFEPPRNTTVPSAAGFSTASEARMNWPHIITRMGLARDSANTIRHYRKLGLLRSGAAASTRASDNV